MTKNFLKVKSKFKQVKTKIINKLEIKKFNSISDVTLTAIPGYRVYNPP